MKILVTGINGQVGWELLRSCQPLGLVAGTDRTRLDLASAESIRAAVRAFRPDIILNPAAYTAVDSAEENQAAALRVNGDAVAVLAGEAADLGALLVHYSTDYVFDGSKAEPYDESDLPNPISAYGRTKLAGERALLDSRADWLCLRTSWIYGARGHNFLRTMLRLAYEREELRVVSDQVGAPTSARLIADATAQLLPRALRERSAGAFTSAVLHLAAAGATSWHGFASRIVAAAQARATAPAPKVRRIVPIATEAYPLPARRPRNSRLDCTLLGRRYGLTMPDWERGLELCLAELD